MSRSKRPHLHTVNMHDETYELAKQAKKRLEELVAQWRKVLKAQNNPQYKKLDELSFPLDWVIRLALYEYIGGELEDGFPKIWAGVATQEEIEFIKTLRREYWF